MEGDQTAAQPPCNDIDGIELIEQIHNGEFGSVWRALDTELQVPRAVKFPTGPRADELLEEARRLARLRHDRLVSVITAGRCGPNQVPFIVLEWMAGGTLAERVLAHGLMDEQDLVRIGADLAGALAVVHEHGMLHGDVSTSNAMFDVSDHLRGLIHLTDFGAAQQIGAGSAAVPEVLNLAFAAPEALGRQITQASDVWSLAVTLWFAGTLAYPFGAAHEVEAAKTAIAAGRRPMPEAWTDAFKQLIAECLSTDPSRRPTARNVKETLEGIMSESELRADPVGDPAPQPADVQPSDTPLADRGAGAAPVAVSPYDAMKGVTFSITVTRVDGQQHTGTGVLVSDAGIVATTASLVKEARDRRNAVELVDRDGRQYYGEILSYEMGFTLNLRRGFPGMDLAFLGIGNVDMTPPEFATTVPVDGETVIAIGNAGGLRFNNLSGEVRNRVDGPTPWIVHSTGQAEGDVGSPLFDESGRLVGLNSWVRALNTPFSYALPASLIADRLATLTADLQGDSLNHGRCCLACGRRSLRSVESIDFETGSPTTSRTCDVCGSYEENLDVVVGFAPIRSTRTRFDVDSVLADPSKQVQQMWEFPEGTTSSLVGVDGVRKDLAKRDLDGNAAGLVSFIKQLAVGTSDSLTGALERQFWTSLSSATDELRVARFDPFTDGVYAVPSVGRTSLAQAAAFLVGACSFYLRNAKLDAAQQRELFRKRRQRIADLLARREQPDELGEYPDGPALVSELGVLAYRTWSMCGPDGKVPENGFTFDTPAPAGTFESGAYTMWHDLLLFYLLQQDRKAQRAIDSVDPVRGSTQNRIELGDALRQRAAINNQLMVNSAGAEAVELESRICQLSAFDGWLTAMAMTLAAKRGATGTGAGGDLGEGVVINGRQEIQARQRWIRQDIATLAQALRAPSITSAG